MTDDERVRDFQRKLYLKAKQDTRYRFYTLYDKMWLPHVLRESYRRVKANRGAPGVDGVTFKEIEKEGALEFLHVIQKELQEKKYLPQAVLRVMIPKANGKLRPLGIPTIRDRVVQMACKMIIEPIFEADFQESSYGFRPKRKAADAVDKIMGHLNAGRKEVYDADLSNYFDTIPHNKLLLIIGKRISDPQILHLIKLWLKSPVKEEDGRISGGKRSRKGTPQGGVISPLLSNIYLNLVDCMIGKMQNEGEDIHIVRYADDFTLMGKHISERVIMKLKDVLRRMEIELNDEKTKMISADKNPFNFLGFTFHRRWSRYERGKKYYHLQPSIKSLSKIKANIKDYLKHNLHKGKMQVIKVLNLKLKGWFNYYTQPDKSQIWKSADHMAGYLKESLYRYYKRKSQRHRTSYSRNLYYIWKGQYGLVDPFSWCKAESVNV